MFDGQQVYNEENTDPRTFDKVKVFAGDNFQDSVDASYSNLLWTNFGWSPPRSWTPAETNTGMIILNTMYKCCTVHGTVSLLV